MRTSNGEVKKDIPHFALKFDIHIFRRLAITIVACLAGCTTTVIPPLNPPNPTQVYLCDYGVHSSLLLPVGDGRYVEYLYGDWNWAALHHTSWIDAIGAIFWSGQSTLGRRYLTLKPGTTMPVPPDGPLTEVGIIVNGDGCRQTVDQLDRRWLKNLLTALVPAYPEWDMTFVRDDEHYSWLHDCNLHTADCLHQMGCKIVGYAVWSKFDVKPPERAEK